MDRLGLVYVKAQCDLLLALAAPCQRGGSGAYGQESDRARLGNGSGASKCQGLEAGQGQEQSSEEFHGGSP